MKQIFSQKTSHRGQHRGLFVQILCGQNAKEYLERFLWPLSNWLNLPFFENSQFYSNLLAHYSYY